MYLGIDIHSSVACAPELSLLIVTRPQNKVSIRNLLSGVSRIICFLTYENPGGQVNDPLYRMVRYI